MHPASSLFSISLLVVTCLCSDVLCSADNLIDYRRPIKVQITCCKSVSPAKIKSPITEFKIQSLAKPCVNAVIFRTENDGSFCSDPKANWVRKKVEEMSEGKVKLPTGRKGGKKQKNNNKNKQKRKTKRKKAPVTPFWFPSTAAATAPTLR